MKDTIQKMMYLKVYHRNEERGLLKTSKSDEVYSWESETPDEIVAIDSPDALKDALNKYPEYKVSHRAKTGDQRHVSATKMFNAFAS